jgi:AraC-like DNA-binding protein
VLQFSAKIGISVDIAAYLHPNLLAHLTITTGGAHRILGSESWDSLSFRIRTEPVDVAVLDPAADGTVKPEPILELLEEFPSVPVVLYTQLSPETLLAMIGLAKAGVRNVVLYRYDDDPKRFMELLESQPGAAMAQMLILRIEKPLARMGPSLKRMVERVFGSPSHYETIPDMATTALVSTRSVYRKFHEVGFASPRKFLVAARLLRAYAYMQEPGTTLEGAGHKLGYEPNSFRRHVRLFFGRTPQQIRREFTPHEFVEKLAVQLYPGPGDDPPP